VLGGEGAEVGGGKVPEEGRGRGSRRSDVEVTHYGYHDPSHIQNTTARYGLRTWSTDVVLCTMHFQV
jgi:hypothetical protein